MRCIGRFQRLGDGVKGNFSPMGKLSQNKLKLSVNSTNSGDGNEEIPAKYNGENIVIGFNSKYLIDIASEIEDKDLTFNLKDSTSPVLVLDNSDKNSFYVIMPMKI